MLTMETNKFGRHIVHHPYFKRTHPDSQQFLGIQSIVEYRKGKEQENQTVSEDGTVIVVEKKSRIKLNEEQITDIREGSETMTIKELAEKTGLSYSQVSQFGKKEGLQFVKGKKGKKAKEGQVSMTNEMISEIKKQSTDKTCKELSAILGLEYSKLYVWGKKNGVVFKKGIKGNKNLGKTNGKVKVGLSPEIMNKIKELGSTMTCKQVAEQMELDYAKVYLLGKKEGIQFVAGVRGRQRKVVVA